MKNLNSILVIIMSLVVLFGSASISVSPHKTPEKNKTSDQTENQTETVEQNNTSDYIKDTSDMSDKCEQSQKQNEDTAQKGKTEDTSDTVNKIEEEKPEIKPEQPQNETASEIDEGIEITQSTEKAEKSESLPQAEINEKATETSEPEPEKQTDNATPKNTTEGQQSVIGKIISDYFKQDTSANESVAVSNNGEVSEYEKEVAELVNEIRKDYGLSALKLNTELSAVARTKSADMREKGYFSHTSPTYGSPFDMMKSFGIKYKTAGENIAMGYKTPQAVVDGWMNSKGHRENILNPSFTEIGVGYVENGNYWTQMFIG